MRKIISTLLFIALICVVYGKEDKKKDDYSYIYIVMSDNDTPTLDYEGDGFLKMWEANAKTKSKLFECKLIVIQRPKGITFIAGKEYDKLKYNLVKFEGILKRIGKDKIKITGTLETKIPCKIQFVKMIKDNDKTKNEFPELVFKKGTSKISFSGTVTGWFEKD